MRKRRGGGKGKRRHNGREGYREREGGTGRGKEGEGEGSVTLLSHEELLYLFRVFVQDLARAYVTSQLLKLSLAHHRLFLALRHGCGAEKPSNLSYPSHIPLLTKACESEPRTRVQSRQT